MNNPFYSEDRCPNYEASYNERTKEDYIDFNDNEEDEE